MASYLFSTLYNLVNYDKDILSNQTGILIWQNGYYHFLSNSGTNFNMECIDKTNS